MKKESAIHQVRCSGCSGSGSHPMGGKHFDCGGTGLFAFDETGKRVAARVPSLWRERQGKKTEDIFVVGKPGRNRRSDG